jgi:hypothetical protein
LGRNIGVVNGTEANPLHLTFDFLLDNAGSGTSWLDARHYIELRGYENGSLNNGALQTIVAAGVNNNSKDTFDGDYYQGRVELGANQWYTLDAESSAPTRSAGWHKFDVEIRGSDIRFSIDGILSEVVARPNQFAFDSILLGSGLTAGGYTAWVDNLRVADSVTGVVPEATSILIWSLLGLTLAVGSSHRRLFSP